MGRLERVEVWARSTLVSRLRLSERANWRARRAKTTGHWRKRARESSPRGSTAYRRLVVPLAESTSWWADAGGEATRRRRGESEGEDCLPHASQGAVSEACMGAGCDESGVTATLSRQGINNMSQRGAITGEYRAEERAN